MQHMQFYAVTYSQKKYFASCTIFFRFETAFKLSRNVLGEQEESKFQAWH